MKLRKTRRIPIKLIVVSVLMAACGLAVWFARSQEKHITRPPMTTPAAQHRPSSSPASPRQVKFAAMGDMLAHDSVVNQAKTPGGYDFSPYFSAISSLYAHNDLVFCNAETPVAGAAYGISGYPTFNAPTEFARDLKNAGCNMVNLATNHIADKGQPAINATLDQWSRLGVAFTGASRSPEEQQKISVVEKNGLKIAFLAFADTSNAPLPANYSVNLYRDKALVKKLLTAARSQADIVVVSAHWGVENSHTVSAGQRAAAQEFSHLGADVIIGTGPHVLQSVEFVPRPDGQKTLVWYSIGNMLSSQLAIDQLTGGVAQFSIAKQGGALSFSDISFTGTLMSYEWSAADKAANRLHKRHNLSLKPLALAQREAGLFGVTVEERSQKIRQWLGVAVPELKVVP